jgi:hypothetical protein
MKSLIIFTIFLILLTQIITPTNIRSIPKLFNEKNGNVKSIRVKLHMIKRLITTVLNTLGVSKTEIKKSLGVGNRKLMSCMDILTQIAHEYKKIEDIVLIGKLLKFEIKDHLLNKVNVNAALKVIKKYIHNRHI